MASVCNYGRVHPSFAVPHAVQHRLASSCHRFQRVSFAAQLSSNGRSGLKSQYPHAVTDDVDRAASTRLPSVARPPFLLLPCVGMLIVFKVSMTVIRIALCGVTPEA
jgi:hypothetical protein